MHSLEPFKEIAPGVLRIREGGGCIALFGLPFLASGVFLALIGGRFLPLGNSANVPPWAWPLIFLMGAAFIAAGGGLTLGRRWITLDRNRWALLKQWGLLFPMRQEECSLQGFESVVIRFEASDSDTADRYPVILRAGAAGGDLALHSGASYPEARQCAAVVTGFLHLSLIDATTDHESVLRPEEISRTFQERLTSHAGGCEMVDQPAAMRSEVDQSVEKTRIVIPGPGFRPTKLLGLLLPAAIQVFLVPNLLQFFRKTHTPEGFQALFIGFVVLFFGIVPALGVVFSIRSGMRSRTTITVWRDGIEIEELGLRKKNRTLIPAEEIFDLDYGTVRTARSASSSSRGRIAGSFQGTDSQTGAEGAPQPWPFKTLMRLAESKGVIVKSSKGIFPFGAGLADQEVLYLHSVVRDSLAGPSPTRR